MLKSALPVELVSKILNESAFVSNDIAPILVYLKYDFSSSRCLKQPTSLALSRENVIPSNHVRFIFPLLTYAIMVVCRDDDTSSIYCTKQITWTMLGVTTPTQRRIRQPHQGANSARLVECMAYREASNYCRLHDYSPTSP